MELKQPRKRWPWGLVFLVIIFSIFLFFRIQAWLEKPRQTKPIAYLFDQPVTASLETSEDWLRGAVWIKPRLYATSAAFSPDGQLIAVPMGFGVIGIVRAQDGSLVRMMAAHKSRIKWVAFSPDGRFLASIDAHNEIRLWSLANGETVKRFTCGSLCGKAAFSPDGHFLAVGDQNTIRVWEIEAEREQAIPTGEFLYLDSSLEFSDDGQLIAAGLFVDGTIKVWRARDGTELFAIKEQKTFGPVNLSLRGSLLASATPDGVIKLWRLPEGSLVRTISAHRKAELSSVVLFSPSGDMLASSSGETIKLWSPEGRFLGRLDWQAGWPLAFSPDGKYLLSGGTTLKLWQLSDRSLKLNLGGIHVFRPAIREWVEALVFSADGSLLASSFSYNSEEGVKLWRMPEGRLEKILPTQGHALAFSPDGQLLAVAEPQAVTLWRIADGKRVRSHSCRVASFTNYSVAFSPDGTLLAAACENQITAWKVSDGSQLFSMRGREKGIAFSPDSQLLAVNGAGVKLYSTRDGKEVRTLYTSSCGRCAIAFSSDGQLVAASLEFDSSIKIWKVSGGQEIRSYVTQGGYWSDIQALAFVPSSKIVAIAEGEVIKLWDVENDQWVGILQGHGGSIDSRIKALAASPDGKYLASGGADGLALWQIQDE